MYGNSIVFNNPLYCQANLQTNKCKIPHALFPISKTLTDEEIAKCGRFCPQCKVIMCDCNCLDKPNCTSTNCTSCNCFCISIIQQNNAGVSNEISQLIQQNIRNRYQSLPKETLMKIVEDRDQRLVNRTNFMEIKEISSDKDAISGVQELINLATFASTSQTISIEDDSNDDSVASVAESTSSTYIPNQNQNQNVNENLMMTANSTRKRKPKSISELSSKRAQKVLKINLKRTVISEQQILDVLNQMDPNELVGKSISQIREICEKEKSNAFYVPLTLLLDTIKKWNTDLYFTHNTDSAERTLVKESSILTQNEVVSWFSDFQKEEIPRNGINFLQLFERIQKDTGKYFSLHPLDLFKSKIFRDLLILYEFQLKGSNLIRNENVNASNLGELNVNEFKKTEERKQISENMDNRIATPKELADFITSNIDLVGEEIKLTDLEIAFWQATQKNIRPSTSVKCTSSKCILLSALEFIPQYQFKSGSEEKGKPRKPAKIVKVDIGGISETTTITEIKMEQ